MQRVAIAGAGAWGCALARRLARAGHDVTLIDRHPPGHVRAASGGESRLIRCAHGADPGRFYTRSARRARELWRELERERAETLFVESGLAWLARRADGWEDASEAVLRAEEIPVSRLAPEDAAPLFPSFAGEDLAFVLFEPQAGVLHARQATQALAASAQAHGARLELGEATPADGGARVELDGVAVAADVVVWACGAWLRGLFPELVDVRVTRQDYWYFGTPTGWETPGVPAFVDYDGAFYGHGDLDGRGFKLAPDAEGPELDPERGERGPNPRGARSARAYLARRFPALAEAPVLGTRVCQYAVTPDSEFVLAPHPQHPHVWLLGGDSGHGFKHAPALAEHVAELVVGTTAPEARFGLGPRAAAPQLRTAGADAQ